MKKATATITGCLIVAAVAAETRAEPERQKRPMAFEVGLNTRHFSPASEAQGVAFRSASDMPGVSFASEAVTSSLRFTGRTILDIFVGVEGEVGALIDRPGSNLAGAYAVAGIRKELRPIQLAVEVVGGRRWIRYELSGGPTDPGAWIAEPRVRGDIWLGSRVTLGGAVGATLGDSSVWMAGVYVGVTSEDYGRWR